MVNYPFDTDENRHNTKNKQESPLQFYVNSGKFYLPNNSYIHSVKCLEKRKKKLIDSAKKLKKKSNSD